MRERFTSLERYDKEALERLQGSTAAVVGLGATGSVIAEHLARHGVQLHLVDRDFLEENDLYSSNIYLREDVKAAKPKARALAERLEEFTEVSYTVGNLDAESLELLDSADIVIDGTDNIATRRLINAYCHSKGKPWVYTSAVGEQGYSIFLEKECFECGLGEIVNASPETCETSGIMREVAAAVASRSSKKTVEYLSGGDVEEVLETFSGASLEVDSPGCKVCDNGEIPGVDRREVFSVCGENKFQVEIEEPDLEKVSRALDNSSSSGELVRGDKDGSNIAVFRSGRAIIEARTRDEARQKLSELGV